MEERVVDGQKVLAPVLYLAQAESRNVRGGSHICARYQLLMSAWKSAADHVLCFGKRGLTLIFLTLIFYCFTGSATLDQRRVSGRPGA